MSIFITEAKALNKEIKSIGVAGKKLDTRIHLAALGCLHQAEKHSNIDPALNLVAVMPKSARTNALLEWFITFGKFNYNDKTKKLTFAKDNITNLEGAEAMPFWELKPEAPFKGCDLDKLIQAAIKKAEAALEDTENAEHHSVDVDKLKKLKALA